jgi:YegS/Rv2252/BmrU family lipid kinase
VIAAVICNPHAGRGTHADRLRPALDVLERAGWELTVTYSAAAGDATRMAREAVASGSDAVIAAGGDGTLNEAIQALAGTDIAVGYLPYGTVNIWARELNMPMQVDAAAAAIVDGLIKEVDLGLANDRYFLLMAGIGFDGEVVRRARTLERHKHRFGVLPYVAAGVSTLPVFRGIDVELRYDGLIRRVQALMLVVGNTRLYGGRYHFTPNAVANDGWLDLCIVKGRGQLAMIRQSLPLLLLGSIGRSDVEMLRVRELSVHTDEASPMQVDGELGGSTPVQFRVAPKALKVIVPKGFNSDLIV